MDEIRTGAMTQGQFVIDYQNNGNGGCIPVIDGKPEPSLMFGYASESDKKACMKLLEDALRATNGDIYQTKMYIMNAVTTAAKEIKPDEAVEVEGTEILLSYGSQKAYLGTEEVANLEDIKCELPEEAVKALLTSRATVEIQKRIEERIEWENAMDNYDDGEDF